MSIDQRVQKLVDEFNKFQDWESRYKHIIELGKNLPEMNEDLKIESNKVKGCQSQVWLHASLNPDKTVHFVGDSDALIVKGLVAVVLMVYSDEMPQEILSYQRDFLKEIGFEGNLSPSRANGLASMIKQVKYYAMAFSLLK